MKKLKEEADWDWMSKHDEWMKNFIIDVPFVMIPFPDFGILAELLLGVPVLALPSVSAFVLSN